MSSSRRCELGIDAAAAQEQQFLHAVPEGGFDHVGLDHEVLVNEVGGVGGVGVDAADLGRSQVDLIGLLCRKEAAHGGLVGQVELGVGAGDDVALGHAIGLQLAHDGRADHAAVAGHVDAGLGAHGLGAGEVRP